MKRAFQENHGHRNLPFFFEKLLVDCVYNCWTKKVQYDYTAIYEVRIGYLMKEIERATKLNLMVTAHAIVYKVVNNFLPCLLFVYSI